MRLRQVASLMLVLLIPTACGGSTATPTMAKGSSMDEIFKIYILAERPEGRLNFDFESAWAVLRQIDLSGALEITGSDIASYDWSNQSIRLTTHAANKVKNSPIIAANWNLDGQGFVVTLAGERLYGGVFAPLGSARSIRYPVIYPQITNDTVIFMLRPTHVGGQLYSSLDPTLKKRIEIKAVHDYFASLRKLIE